MPLRLTDLPDDALRALVHWVHTTALTPLALTNRHFHNLDLLAHRLADLKCKLTKLCRVVCRGGRGGPCTAGWLLHAQRVDFYGLSGHAFLGGIDVPLDVWEDALDCLVTGPTRPTHPAGPLEAATAFLFVGPPSRSEEATRKFDALVATLSEHVVLAHATRIMFNSCGIDLVRTHKLGGACANGALAKVTNLNLSVNQIGDAGVSALADACANGALAKVTNLNLGFNQIGDRGLPALADACAKGALAQLTALDLSHNMISDVGLTALAQATTPDKNGKGAFARVICLGLGGNAIGDEGLAALASACANGALAQLTTLVLGSNMIRDAGLTALANACAKGALAQVTDLYLNDNQIGNNGLTAFADACASGALAQLRSLRLGGNQIGDAGVSALADVVAKGALESLKTLGVDHPKLKEVCDGRGVCVADW